MPSTKYTFHDFAEGILKSVPKPLTVSKNNVIIKKVSAFLAASSAQGWW